MIDALLDAMTLEEQVALLAGADFWTTVPIDRLGVPKIKVSDGPNGVRGGGSLVGGVKSAAFPVGIAIGATWNPALVAAMGAALAEEAASKGARVLLAPTVNIHRSGLNGRNFECYSEDPTLTAELGVAYVSGLQGGGVAATMKHFVGNESEIERTTMSSEIDERTLREIYLPPFEAAVKRAGLMAVMTSYNRLNGTFTSEHRWLLAEVLRGDWGFDGLVMSDWFGSHATAETVNAGLDLEMPGPTRDRGARLVAAVEAGAVAPETIRARARAVLRLIERVGGFADPVMPAERADDRPAHRALIRRLGAEAMVLLKNDGILPLDPATVGAVAVLGPNGGTGRIMGGGSARLDPHYAVSPADGIRAALAGSNRVVAVRGCGNDRLIRRLDGPIEAAFFDTTDFSGPVVHRERYPFGEAFWGDAPSPTLTSSAFSCRLTATFRPEESGPHLFGVTSAGLARLFVDGVLVVDSWDGWTVGASNFFGRANEEVRAPLVLEAGRAYAITVDYRTPVDGVGLGVRAVRFGVERPLGDAGIAEAVAAAREADVALVFVGRNGEWDCEGNDLPGLTLPGRQDELVAAVAAVNRRVVVVLQTGGPVAMPWLDDVAAVVEAWYPGQEAGNAVADVLFGATAPGGRLPQTFPLDLADNAVFSDDPLTYPGRDGRVCYAEGVFVGYRHFDRLATAEATGVLFPFGFGLGYTRFRWREPRLSAPTFGPGGVTVEVDVTNVGDRRGAEVVQLYVAPPPTSVARPVKELRAFAKLDLAPGETATAVLRLDHRALAWFDVAARGWVADAGAYRLIVAANAAEPRAETTVVLGETWRAPA
jgi:beta-glucosidase